MRRVYSCLVLFVLLILGTSSAMVAEDLPDTPYDESETQPYESSTSIPNLMGQTAWATQTALSETEDTQSTLSLQTSILFRLGAKTNPRCDTPFTSARSLLTLVCTLLL
jgi:hypothetical protein